MLLDGWNKNLQLHGPLRNELPMPDREIKSVSKLALRMILVFNISDKHPITSKLQDDSKKNFFHTKSQVMHVNHLF